MDPFYPQILIVFIFFALILSLLKSERAKKEIYANVIVTRLGEALVCQLIVLALSAVFLLVLYDVIYSNKEIYDDLLTAKEPMHPLGKILSSFIFPLALTRTTRLLKDFRKAKKSSIR